MCQLTLFLLMTSFMACHSRGEHKAPPPPETGLSNATRTTTPAGLVTVHHSNSSSGMAFTTGSDMKRLYLPPLNENSPISHQRPGLPEQLNLTSANNTEADTSMANDSAENLDMTSLFSSFSSPGDLLADSEIAEILNNGGLWTNDRVLKKKLKPHRKRLVNKGLVSKKTYKRFAKIIFCLVALFIIVGLVTNALALKVFRGLGKNVTNSYMRCLCCFDIGYLVFLACAIVATLVVRWVTLPQSVSSRFLWLYDFSQFFITSTRQVVIVTTALMSLDRYFAINSAFGTRRATLFRRPRLLVGVCFLLVLVLNCPMLLKRQVCCGRVEGISQSVCYLTYTPLYLQHRSLWDNVAIVSSCVFQYCPLLTMLVANFALIISLHRYSTSVRITISSMLSAETSSPTDRPRDRDTSHDFLSAIPSISSTVSSCHGIVTPSHRQFFRLERGKCVTVIVYSLLFFLLALPLAVLPAVKKALPEFNVLRHQHFAFLTYTRLLHLLDTLSASINFFVFFAKGGAFRAAVMRGVRCGRVDTKRGTFRLRAGSRGNLPWKSLGGVWPWVCRQNALSAVVLKRSVVRRES